MSSHVKGNILALAEPLHLQERITDCKLYRTLPRAVIEDRERHRERERELYVPRFCKLQFFCFTNHIVNTCTSKHLRHFREALPKAIANILLIWHHEPNSFRVCRCCKIFLRFGAGHKLHKSDPLSHPPCHQAARVDGQSSPALVDPQAPTKGTSMAQCKPKCPHSSSEHLLDDGIFCKRSQYDQTSH